MPILKLRILCLMVDVPSNIEFPCVVAAYLIPVTPRRWNPDIKAKNNYYSVFVKHIF